MFDAALPTVEALRHADDAEVVAAITGCAQVEAAAAARRLAAIAELVRRRANGPTDCAQWSCDNWDAVAAEVAAAQGISHGMASGQMYLGVALRDRLPRVAVLFTEGAISARLAATIMWHTDLIKDPPVKCACLQFSADDACCPEERISRAERARRAAEFHSGRRCLLGGPWAVAAIIAILRTPETKGTNLEA